MPKISVEAAEPDVPGAGASRTATKTHNTLRDVPQSISVVTRSLIQDQSMQGLADVARYIPGAGMAQGEGNRDTIILRGSSSTADFLSTASVTTSSISETSTTSTSKLKGPNAMIFGRGGAGGVINRVTRQADWDRAEVLVRWSGATCADRSTSATASMRLARGVRQRT
jgi:catecholate siderophore receptor